MSLYFLLLQFNMYLNSLKPFFITGVSTGAFKAHKFRKRLALFLTVMMHVNQ